MLITTTGIIELIETLWNVNCLLEYFEYLEGKELIETLWNVNEPEEPEPEPEEPELIETLWNVNS